MTPASPIKAKKKTRSGKIRRRIPQNVQSVAKMKKKNMRSDEKG